MTVEMKVVCTIPMKYIIVQVCAEVYKHGKWGAVSCEEAVERTSTNLFNPKYAHEAEVSAAAQCKPGWKMRTWGSMGGWALPPLGPPGPGVPTGVTLPVNCSTFYS